MINDINFSNSFKFNIYEYRSCKHTDNSMGIGTHYLAYMIAGRGKIVSEEECVNVSEGDVFYIPNGCKYNSCWHGEPDIKFISLGFVYMPNFENKNYKLQVIPSDEGAVRRFFDIIERGEVDSVGIGMLYMLIGNLMPNMLSTSKNKNEILIENAKKFIMSNINANVADIAKAMAVSESALYLAFRKHSSVSINEFRMSVILERAKDLLISTNISIEELCRRLAFSSSSYFRKCFKSYFGKSPKQIRNNYGV